MVYNFLYVYDYYKNAASIITKKTFYAMSKIISIKGGPEMKLACSHSCQRSSSYMPYRLLWNYAGTF